jgi:hypothetical protein
MILPVGVELGKISIQPTLANITTCSARELVFVELKFGLRKYLN